MPAYRNGHRKFACDTGRRLPDAGRRACWPPNSRTQPLSADAGTRFTVTNLARNNSSISSRVAGGMRCTKSSSGGNGPFSSTSVVATGRLAGVGAPKPCSRCSARNAASSPSVGPTGAPSSTGAPGFSVRTLLAGASSSPPAELGSRRSPLNSGPALMAADSGLSRFFLPGRPAGSRPAWRSL